MLKPLWDKEERKVEYIELIYDLIFVYLVSRNVSLLHVIYDGFVTPMVYGTYLASTLAILQVWYLSALYINHYGDGSLREHLMLFFNMYLLYYMADGIRVDWGPVYFRYNGAWALILLNLAVQYYRMGRAAEAEQNCRGHRRSHALMLLIEAAIVLLSMPIYAVTGYALAPWALVFGAAAHFLTWKVDRALEVDFPHLAERVMLYIVFTFGEMILGITGYFDGGFSLKSVYYSLMAFALVAGLFSGYGHYYNHLLDPERRTSGIGYMALHILMVLALNNITAALEFLQDVTVRPGPRTAFLVASVLIYYLCLLSTQRYAKHHVADMGHFLPRFLGSILIYCAAAALCYRWPMVIIALTVAFIYLQLYALHFGDKEQHEKSGGS